MAIRTRSGVVRSGRDILSMARKLSTRRALGAAASMASRFPAWSRSSWVIKIQRIGGVDLLAQRLDEPFGLGVQAGLDQDRLACLDEVGVYRQIAEWSCRLVVREHHDVFSCRIRRVHEPSPVA